MPGAGSGYSQRIEGHVNLGKSVTNTQRTASAKRLVGNEEGRKTDFPAEDAGTLTETDAHSYLDWLRRWSRSTSNLGALAPRAYPRASPTRPTTKL